MAGNQPTGPDHTIAEQTVRDVSHNCQSGTHRGCSGYAWYELQGVARTDHPCICRCHGTPAPLRTVPGIT